MNIESLNCMYRISAGLSGHPCQFCHTVAEKHFGEEICEVSGQSPHPDTPTLTLLTIGSRGQLQLGQF